MLPPLATLFSSQINVNGVDRWQLCLLCRCRWRLTTSGYGKTSGNGDLFCNCTAVMTAKATRDAGSDDE